MELQLEHSRVQIAELIREVLEKKCRWSGEMVPGTSKEGDLGGVEREFVEMEESRLDPISLWTQTGLLTLFRGLTPTDGGTVASYLRGRI